MVRYSVRRLNLNQRRFGLVSVMAVQFTVAAECRATEVRFYPTGGPFSRREFRRRARRYRTTAPRMIPNAPHTAVEAKTQRAIGFAHEIDWLQRRGPFGDAAGIQQQHRQHSPFGIDVMCRAVVQQFVATTATSDASLVPVGVNR